MSVDEIYMKDTYHDYTSTPGGAFFDERYQRQLRDMNRGVAASRSRGTSRKTMRVIENVMKAGIYVFVAIAGLSLLSRNVR